MRKAGLVQAVWRCGQAGSTGGALARTFTPKRRSNACTHRRPASGSLPSFPSFRLPDLARAKSGHCPDDRARPPRGQARTDFPNVRRADGPLPTRWRAVATARRTFNRKVRRAGSKAAGVASGKQGSPRHFAMFAQSRTWLWRVVIRGIASPFLKFIVERMLFTVRQDPDRPMRRPGPPVRQRHRSI